MSAATMYVPGFAPAAYTAALEGLTALNQVVLEGGPFPRLYDAGVRYKREPMEAWKHAGLVMRDRAGDCEDLSAWRAAELRVTGEDPGAHVWTYRTGPNRLHAVVRRSDGSIEDPSVMLGMQPADPAARIIDDPTPGDDEITYDATPDGRTVFLRVPMHGGKAVVFKGESDGDVMGAWTDPLRRVFKVATAVLATPEIQAILPPKARLALIAAKRAEGIKERAETAWKESAPKKKQKKTSAPPVYDVPTEPPPVRATAVTPEVEEEVSTMPAYDYSYPDPTDPGMGLMHDDVMGLSFGSVFNAIPGVRIARAVASRVPVVKNLPGVRSRGGGGASASRGAPQQAQSPYGYPPDPYAQQSPYGYPPDPYTQQSPYGYPQSYGQSFNPSSMPPSYGPAPYPSPQDYMPQFDPYQLPMMYQDYGDPSAPPGGWNPADAMLYADQYGWQ